ncbi:MAG: hypothetical protein V4515_10970 [Chloroflexota bacterium]
MLIGVVLVGTALAAYWLPGSVRFYNHFVWQAMAFLGGQAAIPWPVPGNDYFQDVFPVRDATGNLTGYGLLPFPPLPAIVLMPVVAIFGLATDQRVVSVVIGAVVVGLCWWAMGRLPISRPVRLAVTIFFGFGTVFWYAAGLGTTWFLAHVVALVPAFLAVGIALGGDRELQAEDDDRGVDRQGAPSSDERLPLERLASAARDALREVLNGLARPGSLIDRRQFAAGLLFGLASTARLTMLFGAPFFIFVGSGGSVARRAVSAGLGAIIPVALLLGYNLATTGQLFHPGYEYLYRLEAAGYPALGYHPAWSIEDVRYIPQNLWLMLAGMPAILPDRIPSGLGPGAFLCTAPDAVRGLFDPACPIALPRDVGMSILLTSPAYLLAIPALRRAGRSRLVAGALVAVVAIAVVNLMHFSQGWVQFGYRFSNDFVVFALPLVALGMSRRSGGVSHRGEVGLLAAWLIGLSVAINFWGMTWGNLLGW